jgi:anthranilate 1,2-dioxygenase small subunit
MNDEQQLYFQIDRLFAEYCACLDEDRLEDWPELFVEDGVYRMVSRENFAHGFQIPLVLLDSKGMMRDRVFSLRNANIFQPHRYRHAISAVRITARTAEFIEVTSSYIVVQTLNEGTTDIYQAGSYYDQLCATPAGLRFKQRLVIYDTSRVQTLLATPV